MASNNKPAIAAMGLGYWGKNLVRNLHQLGLLAVMYDSDKSVLDEFAARYPDVAVADDPESVFGNKNLDGVVIATPAESHGELVAQSLNAGLHTFVEKPLCLDLGEADALRRLADQSGLVLMVGHLMLYHPAFEALSAVVAKGQLGNLRYIYSNRASLGKIRQEENALWSFAPHDISMILSLVGRMPTSVVANGGSYLSKNVADTTLSHLDFEGGVQAHIFVSWLHPFKEQRLVVVGERGMIVFNDVQSGPEKLLHYAHEARWDGEVPLITQVDPMPVPYGSNEPLKAECQAFVHAIECGEAPPSDAKEGVRVLQVLDACQRALVSRTPIVLESST